MSPRLSFTAAVTALAFSVLPAQAQSEGEVYSRIEQLHGNAEAFAGPFAALTQAMGEGDAETVADLAEYPLQVNANGETYDIQNAQDFVDNFDSLVMEETRRAVARQRYDTLFVNSDGVMLADGAVWMGAVCDDDEMRSVAQSVEASGASTVQGPTTARIEPVPGNRT